MKAVVTLVAVAILAVIFSSCEQPEIYPCPDTQKIIHTVKAGQMHSFHVEDQSVLDATWQVDAMFRNTSVPADHQYAIVKYRITRNGFDYKTGELVKVNEFVDYKQYWGTRLSRLPSTGDKLYISNPDLRFIGFECIN